MRMTLENEKSPLDADLEKVLPGLNQKLHASQNAVTELGCSLNFRMDRVEQAVTTGFNNIQSRLEAWKEDKNKMIGNVLVQAGTSLLTQNAGATTTDNDLSPYELQELPELNLPKLSEPFVSSTKVKKSKHMQSTLSLDEACTFRLRSRHDSLRSLWNEWHGSEALFDKYGGVDGRNKKYGAAWRRHLNKTQYSRNKQIVSGIMASAKRLECYPEHLMDEWQSIYEQCSLSPGVFIRKMQADGIFVKKAAQGKSKALQH